MTGVLYPFMNGRAIPEAGFSWIAALITAAVLLVVVGLAWRALRSMRREETVHPPIELARAA
jgi:hypothetical protein